MPLEEAMLFFALAAADVSLLPRWLTVPGEVYLQCSSYRDDFHAAAIRRFVVANQSFPLIRRQRLRRFNQLVTKEAAFEKTTDLL